MKKEKNKLLFAIQLPPPVHGASLVNKTLVDNENIQAKYDLDVLEIQLANNMADLGNFSTRKIINAYYIFFKLIKKIILNKYDLIYFTLSPIGFAFYKDFVLVLLIKLFSKNKIIFHLHGKGIKEESKSYFKRKLYSFVFRNTDVIQLAEVLNDDIKSVYSGIPFILPNGIVNNKKELHPIKEDITSFIYLSNLMEDKGILVFLKAIKLLQSIKNEFRVYIVGPSADVTIEVINNYISINKIGNVEVIGPIYGNKKYIYLNKSDVFVLPTYYKNECFPLSILEAFQAGLAVLSTDNGAISNMVKNNINGFLVLQKDAHSLADKMKYLIDNKELLTMIKSNNQIEFSEKYTEEVFISKFIKIIDQVINKS